MTHPSSAATALGFLWLAINLTALGSPHAAAQTSVRKGPVVQLPATVGMGGPIPAIIVQGNAAYARGDLAAAQGAYERAVALQSDVAVAVFNLGVVHLRRGDRARGREEMGRGLALATGTAWALQRSHGCVRFEISYEQRRRLSFSGRSRRYV